MLMLMLFLPRYRQSGQQLHQLQQTAGLHWSDPTHQGGEGQEERQSLRQEESRHQPGGGGRPTTTDRSGGIFQEIWQLAATQGQTVTHRIETFYDLTIYMTFHTI